MRILHCFKVYRPDQTGGIEEAISRVAADTPGNAESSILVCRTRGFGSDLVVEGVPVERTTSFGDFSSFPLSPTYLWRLHRRLQKADVVAFHAPFPFVDLAVRFGYLRADQAFVVHWHGELTGRHWVRPILDPLMRRSVARADRIIVSDAAIIDESPYLRPVRRKCRVIPYGIDTHSWSDLSPADRSQVEDLRAKHPRLVVACGRLVPYKGFDVLLRAMARVDGQLMIIGRGPLRDELQARIASLGLESRVTLTGFLEREEQKRVLNAACLFVLPSTTPAEAFGIAQLEAMSCELPVVNTNLPTAVPQVARHGQEALTVEPGDDGALAEAINRLLDDPVQAARLGRAGRARAHENYDWRSFAASCISTYREALADRRRASRVG